MQEFICYCVYDVLFLIAAIVAAARASLAASIGVTAVSCYFPFCLHVVLMQKQFSETFLGWRY